MRQMMHWHAMNGTQTLLLFQQLPPVHPSPANVMKMTLLQIPNIFGPHRPPSASQHSALRILVNSQFAHAKEDNAIKRR